MALPMNTVDRLADVEESKGTTEVSPMTIATFSGSMPSDSAATWQKTVRAPWPMSDVPDSSVRLPS